MATSQKRSTSTRESATTASRSRTAETSTIESNPLFKASFDRSLSPEQKKAEMKKIFVTSEDSTRNRAADKAVTEYKEFLQTQREEMSKELIRLTDTKTFSNLQGVYDKLTGGVLDFKKKIAPLTDITDALYRLREDGMTSSIYEEIKRDNEVLAKIDADIRSAEADIYNLKTEIGLKSQKNHMLAQEKSFFGLGGITQSAQAKIDANIAAIEQDENKIKEKRAEIEKLKTDRETYASENDQYANEKEKLAELLNLTGEEHQARQQELVDTAYAFVENAKGEIGTIRGSLKDMESQLDNIFNMNNYLTDNYGLMLEAQLEADEENIKIREELNKEVPDESSVEKSVRQRKLMEVNGFVETMSRQAEDSSLTYADLTKQVMNIRTMRSGASQQISGINSLYSRGVAGVAEQLVSALTAVSQAAINESQANSSNALDDMSDVTDNILQKESIRVAMGVAEGGDKFVRAMDSLADYGQIQRDASKITNEGLIGIRGFMDEIKSVTESAKEEMMKDMNEAADIMSGKGANKKEESAGNSDSIHNPFERN